MSGKFYIGTAGWTYPDWKLIFGDQKKRGESELTLLTKWFNCCEINSSFYAIPDEKKAAGWISKIKNANDFLFTVKLYQGFTHEQKLDKDKIAMFKKSISVINDEGRLGALLCQFPYSFKMTDESLKYLSDLAGEFAEYPLTVETRCGAFNSNAFIDFLKEKNIAFCNIDQPAVSGNLPITSHITSDFAYIRFHGRKKETWFKENEGYKGERYDYLYTQREIAEWIDIIKGMLKKIVKVFIITNNHYRGKAVANAMQIKNMLDGSIFEASDSLINEYPELKTITKKIGGGYEELSLF